MNHLKIKRSVVLTLMMTIFVVFSSMMVGYSRPSGEELIIRKFLSSGTVYDRMILNGWAVVHDTDLKTDTVGDFERLVKQFFSPYYYSTNKSTSMNSTTITAKGLIKPKVTATITLVKNNPDKANQSGETYLVLSLESKDPDISYSFLNSVMSSFLGKEYQKSMVIAGRINRRLSPQEKDKFINDMFQKMDVQNMETLKAGELVSVTGYTPSVRNMLTVAGKSVNINMALRYNTIVNETMVYLGSPVITSEY